MMQWGKSDRRGLVEQITEGENVLDVKMSVIMTSCTDDIGIRGDTSGWDGACPALAKFG